MNCQIKKKAAKEACMIKGGGITGKVIHFIAIFPLTIILIIIIIINMVLFF